MAGLIGTGQAYQQQSQQAFQPVIKDEVERNQENLMAKTAHNQQVASLTGTGAGLGFIAGAGGSVAGGAAAGSWGGPVGALIGAGIGYLAGRLL